MRKGCAIALAALCFAVCLPVLLILVAQALWVLAALL